MGDMFYGSLKPIFQRAEELRKAPTHDELLLWQYLKAKQLSVRFKRQPPIWMYIADFYCHELKLVIEVDGSIHNLEDVLKNDAIREAHMVSLGIKITWFTNKEIRTDIISVVKSIRNTIKELRNINGHNE